MKHLVSGVILLLLSLPAYAADGCRPAWPLWEGFAEVYIQPDGRVIDHDAEAISTSEGQSYALFFSLVANDHARFDRILKWISDNLAQGDLSENLPAWKWGKGADGEWKVLDYNSASDADLWIAYSLFHAAAYWKHGPYRELGAAMLRNIARREVADLPHLGSMLLPAPYGFAINATTWRLNPSYLPIQVLRYFSKIDKDGPWKDLAENTQRMIGATSSKGVVPDWVMYGSDRGFYLDEKGEYSSYDAIRIHLWWAMLDRRDPMFLSLRSYLTEVAQFVPENKYLPERINVRTGEEEGVAPVGFAGALAPYRFVQYQHKPENSPTLGERAGYYNYVLSLFGYGWLDRHFKFNLDGSLTMEAHKKCSK